MSVFIHNSVADSPFIFGIYVGIFVRIAGYFVRSFFTYMLSKERKVTYPFLSWIPFLYPYNYFEMMNSKTIDFFGLFYCDTRMAAVFYIVGSAVIALSSYISWGVGFVLSLLLILVEIALWDNLTRALGVDHPALCIAFCVLMPCAGVMIVFLSYISKEKEQEEKKKSWERIMEDTPDFQVPSNITEDSFDIPDEVLGDGDEFLEEEDETVPVTEHFDIDEPINEINNVDETQGFGSNIPESTMEENFLEEIAGKSEDNSEQEDFHVEENTSSAEIKEENTDNTHEDIIPEENNLDSYFTDEDFEDYF